MAVASFGAINVALTGVVTVTVSEPMDPVTTNPAVTLGVPVTKDWVGNTLVLTPAKLSEGVTYTLTVGTAATNVCGNNIVGATSVSFTTRKVGKGLYGGRCGATAGQDAAWSTLPLLLLYLAGFASQVPQASCLCASRSEEVGVTELRKRLMEKRKEENDREKNTACGTKLN
jgi:hypothetical protein